MEDSLSLDLGHNLYSWGIGCDTVVDMSNCSCLLYSHKYHGKDIALDGHTNLHLQISIPRLKLILLLNAMLAIFLKNISRICLDVVPAQPFSR